jgi:hypothetical protein
MARKDLPIGALLLLYTPPEPADDTAVVIGRTYLAKRLAAVHVLMPAPELGGFVYSYFAPALDDATEQQGDHWLIAEHARYADALAVIHDVLRQELRDGWRATGDDDGDDTG